MSKTIAKYGVLKLYTILSRLIQNKNAKSSTFTFPKQGNLDSDLVTVLLWTRHTFALYAEVKIFYRQKRLTHQAIGENIRGNVSPHVAVAKT